MPPDPWTSAAPTEAGEYEVRYGDKWRHDVRLWWKPHPGFPAYTDIARTPGPEEPRTLMASRLDEDPFSPRGEPPYAVAVFMFPNRCEWRRVASAPTAQGAEEIKP